MALLLALALSQDAHASWPEDVSLSSMTDLGGETIFDSDQIAEAYDDLIKELGTVVANKPMAPAETTGVHGWDMSLYMQFAFNEAIDRGDQESPWLYAHQEEDPRAYQFIPTFGVRKGLPLSTELGANIGWVGASGTGVVGGYGRVAIFEGYKPIPDVTLQLGYSGYVGNDELELGVWDLGVTVGATYATGMIPGANDAQVSPWFNYSTLRVSAAPLLDEETLEEIGAVTYQNSRREAPYTGATVLDPIILPQFGVGMQIVSRNVHWRVGATWAPATIPTLSTGMGFTF